MSRRILIVEDDPGIRNVLAEFLRLYGYEVRSAPDGTTGLAELAERGADVVLLDLMMPVVDGWAFRRDQLANPALARVPTVVITASYAEDADLAPLAVERVLRKPLDFDVLLQAIADAAGSD